MSEEGLPVELVCLVLEHCEPRAVKRLGTLSRQLNACARARVLTKAYGRELARDAAAWMASRGFQSRSVAGAPAPGECAARARNALLEFLYAAAALLEGWELAPCALEWCALAGPGAFCGPLLDLVQRDSWERLIARAARRGGKIALLAGLLDRFPVALPGEEGCLFGALSSIGNELAELVTSPEEGCREGDGSLCVALAAASIARAVGTPKKAWARLALALEDGAYLWSFRHVDSALRPADRLWLGLICAGWDATTAAGCDSPALWRYAGCIDREFTREKPQERPIPASVGHVRGA